MADNDREKSGSQTSGNPGEPGVAEETAPSYHAPTLTSFGALAELVQVNPSVGSDGGVGDCQHI
jgi:hypothetical protein